MLRYQLYIALPGAFLKGPWRAFHNILLLRAGLFFLKEDSGSDRHTLPPNYQSAYHYITKFASHTFNELVKNIDAEISPFFSSEELNQLARESKFVQRESKIDGSVFLDLIVFNSENLKEESLNDLSIELMIRHGIEIKKQSLHERFNNYAVAFLKNALEQLLRNQLGDEIALGKFERINRILIKDSVCFQISESLAEHYPGSGGSGSGAAVRIQFEYDLLTGIINDLSINAFNDQDAVNSVDTIELTKQGDLIIRDLAYMNLKTLRLIASNLAYYLCRTGSQVNVYELRGDHFEKICFRKLAKGMKKLNLDMTEKEVYVGDKDMIRVRLIVHLMPEKEVEKRLRKARANNKKKGRGNLSKEFVARAGLNLFITNTSPEQVPAENVWFLYRLRWQIELMFKIWKSICKIDTVKKVNKYRLECHIFAKLIFIILGWQIIWKVAKNLFVNEAKALSFFKAFKTLFRGITDLRNVFVLKKELVETFMKKFYEISRTNHLLEKRKEEPTSMEILQSCLTI